MKLKLNYKIRGSIMGLVLTVTMLVTVLSAFFILRANMDTQAWLLYDNKDRLLNNANSGLELLLSGNNLVEPGSSTTLDLFEEGNDSVCLERKPWGAFEIVISKAFMGKHSISKKAMLGAKPQDTLPLTLYVCDLQKPLSVCGNTRLVGKCYVSQAGFKRAYIEGQNYSGNKYVYGTQLASKRDLPELNKSMVKFIEDQLKKPVQVTDSVIQFNQVGDTLINPFDKKTIVIESPVVLRMQNCVLMGNIKLVAPEIHIGNSCIIENAIIITHKLTVEDRFSGDFQVLASERVFIGKEVKLNYPTVVTVFPKPEMNANEPHIYFGEKTEVTGDVLCYTNTGQESTEPYISFDKESTVYGNVYVNGKLDAKGKIYGSTYCVRFYLKTNSGVYENHLLNAEFDASKLPGYYMGVPLLKEGSRKEVMQWLY
ncbi:MAG TPA: hypothetical protein VD905_16345 [Flavobacteriales bacterium]|nr:hypothetical protein [Flavobacteriales bacterium]